MRRFPLTHGIDRCIRHAPVFFSLNFQPFSFSLSPFSSRPNSDPCIHASCALFLLFLFPHLVLIFCVNPPAQALPVIFALPVDSVPHGNTGQRHKIGERAKKGWDVCAARCVDPRSSERVDLSDRAVWEREKGQEMRHRRGMSLNFVTYHLKCMSTLTCLLPCLVLLSFVLRAFTLPGFRHLSWPPHLGIPHPVNVATGFHATTYVCGRSPWRGSRDLWDTPGFRWSQRKYDGCHELKPSKRQDR